MSRRNSGAAEAASSAASDAARVLQQRQQETRTEAKAAEPVAKTDTAKGVGLENSRISELRKNPRNDVLEEMAARNGPKESEQAPKAAEKAETPPEPQAQPEKQPSTEEAAPAAAAQAPEAPKVVRVKVDGEEFDAPEADVEAAGGIHAYQRDRASENRLKKANDIMAEARKAQSQIIELATTLQRPAAPPKPQESDQQFIASKMDIVRFGSQEEAGAAMLEIQQRLNKAPDTNAIVEQATSRWRHDQAVAAFDKDFQDLVTNPIRLKTVVALREERLQKHKIEKPNQPVDWDSFYRTIGTEVRSAFGGQSQPATAPQAATGGTPSPASEKEARKASIVNLPAAAARAEAPKEDKPETRQDVLNEMKKRRGLPVG